MTLFDSLERLGFGELHACRDSDTGLRALVGLYSTRLGPAIGGTRLRAYPSEAEAVEDVLLLSRAMAYKAALARLPHGGGKAVIWAPRAGWPATSAQRTALFARFGEFVDALGGRYVTTEDSGTSPADMDVIRTRTRFVVGSSSGSGDPSPLTALGVLRGIEAVVHEHLQRANLKGLRVAIQGVGHVGAPLARLLVAAGAQLIISDVDAARRDALAAELKVPTAPTDAILESECDVLAPCALGGAITSAIVPRLRCRAVAGAANNQLATAQAGAALVARDIFYAPDYAINAGGLIHVAAEYDGHTAEQARQKVLAIYDTILAIAKRSRTEKQPPNVVADHMAEEIIGHPPR